jgi:hypothetical protein
VRVCVKGRGQGAWGAGRDGARGGGADTLQVVLAAAGHCSEAAAGGLLYHAHVVGWVGCNPRQLLKLLWLDTGFRVCEGADKACCGHRLSPPSTHLKQPPTSSSFCCSSFIHLPSPSLSVLSPPLS